MSATAENLFLGAIGRYARSCSKFVREVLGVEPDPWQAEMLEAMDRGETRLAIRSGHGVGKLQTCSDLVPTPDGEWRWGDLQPGDRLFGRDGEPVYIIARHDQGIRPIYRVTFDDGTALRVGAEHLWTVRGRAQRRVDRKSPERRGVGRRERVSGYAEDFITISTAELIKRGVKRANGAALARQWELPPHGPAQYPPQPIEIPPYLLGASLGDGTFRNGTLTLHGSATKIALWERHLDDAGISYSVDSPGDDRDRWALRIHGHMPALRRLGLAGLLGHEKRVPLAYRENTPTVRLSVLQGLMDSDGYCDDRGIAVYTSTSRQLAADVAWLVRSLGGKAFLGEAQASHYTKDGERVRVRDHYDVTVRLPPGLDLFTLPFKAQRMRPCEPRYLTRWIEAIEPDGEEEAMCVTVDAPDGLYLSRDFIVTHNSSCLSWIMAWFILTRFPCKCVVTAPTATQLYDALWADLCAVIKRLPEAWQALLNVQSDHIYLRSRPDEAFIAARTSRAETPDAMQGVHAKHVLLVGDEAAGIPEAVFQAAGGSMSTPGAITILAGNPTRTTGFFHRVHNIERNRWWTRRVSCTDSPRVDPAWVAEIRDRYGEDSNEYRVRVLGEFPLAEGDTIIPSSLVELAMQRLPEHDPGAPEIWGVDVARFGTDSSVLIKRQGNTVLELPRRWQQMDLMQLTGAVVAEAKHREPRAIVVDAIGLGAGVADRLREIGLPTIDVNVAESPSAERFVRLRDELWQAMRDWLETRIVSMPWDDQLRSDLCAPRYGWDSSGRLKIESKDQMRARGVASPDSADSLALTFSPGALMAAAYGVARLNKPLKRRIKGVV